METTFYVPCKNSEKTVSAALFSISRQKIKPKETFVIDGNSKDSTLDICAKNHAKVYIQKDDGLAAARNMAIRKCRTGLIASIDADCELTDDWLAKAEKYFEHDKEGKVGGVCGRLIEKNCRTLADSWRCFHLRQDCGTELIKNPQFLFGSNSMFRLSALKKCGGYDEKFITNFEDVDISRRLRKKGYTLIYDPDLICYHLRKDSLISVLSAARRWTFHSYPLPGNLGLLILRLFIFNPYLAINFIIKDLKALKFHLMLITVPFFIHCEISDIKYFLDI